MMIQFSETHVRNRVMWVRDLVSGNYIQGEGALRRKSNGVVKHCCLGVAGERLCPTSRRMKFISTDAENTVSNDDTLGHDAVRQLGMGDDSLAADGDQRIAYHWNDTGRHSFHRIADFIAWSTEHGLRFVQVPILDVPQDYALTWLESHEHVS